MKIEGAGALFFLVPKMSETEYAGLIVEINKYLKNVLYKTEMIETQAPQATQTHRAQAPRVSGTLPGVSGNFSRRATPLKMPHCGGCKKPVSDEIGHRDCITKLFKRNHIAWNRAIYQSVTKTQ